MCDALSQRCSSDVYSTALPAEHLTALAVAVQMICCFGFLTGLYYVCAEYADSAMNAFSFCAGCGHDVECSPRTADKCTGALGQGAQCPLEHPVEQNQTEKLANGAQPGKRVHSLSVECELSSTAVVDADGQRVSDQKLIEQTRSIPSAGAPIYQGVVIAVCSGMLYGVVIPLINISANDNFHFLPEGVPKLSVYTSNFWFSLGVGSCSVAVTVPFLYHPPLQTAKSTILGWFMDNSWRTWSILSGFLAASGDLMHFLGGQTAGYAASMLTGAFPIVGLVLGLTFFKEFRDTSRLAQFLLAAQVLLYLAGISLLASSASERSTGSVEQ